jgi:hypothetical protein
MPCLMNYPTLSLKQIDLFHGCSNHMNINTPIIGPSHIDEVKGFVKIRDTILVERNARGLKCYWSSSRALFSSVD